MTKRIFALLLIFAMTFTLFACNPSPEEQKPGESGGTSGDNTNENESQIGGVAVDEGEFTDAAGRYDPKLPFRDLSGYEFRVLASTDFDGSGYYGTIDVFSEGPNAEPINDAVFERNTNLEGKYGFKIVEYKADNIYNTINASISANLDEYDVMWAWYGDNINMLNAGLLTDFNKVGNINLKAPWWDQNMIKGISINHKLFLLNGDISIGSKKMVCTVLFNKKLIEELNLENPYDLVDNNTWTQTKMFEMGKTASKDLDGNDIWDANDRYGIMSNNCTIMLLFAAAGAAMGYKDANDIPHFDYITDRNVAVVESLYDYVYDDTLHFNYLDGLRGMSGSPYLNCRNMFANDQILFMITDVSSVTYLRDMESPFGMLPMPKYDSNQESYHHFGGFIATMLSIPNSNPDLDKTGYVIELLAAESKNTLTPAFYDITLKRKMTQDVESIKTLDIIYDTLTFDPFWQYSIGNARLVTVELQDAKTRDFVSRWTRIEEKSQKAIEEIIAIFG